MSVILATLLVLACFGCAGKNSQTPTYPDSASVTRIKVSSNGTIFLNGAQASLEDVKKNFEKLKANNGRVRYYRENPQGEAPEQAMKVVQAVVDAKLPIKLCATEQELNGSD